MSAAGGVSGQWMGSGGEGGKVGRTIGQCDHVADPLSGGDRDAAEEVDHVGEGVGRVLMAAQGPRRSALQCVLDLKAKGSSHGASDQTYIVISNLEGLNILSRESRVLG